MKVPQPDDTSLLQDPPVSCATLATQLTARGFVSCAMQGVHPVRSGMRLVGRAVTLRYLPAREDVSDRLRFDNATNPQRIAIESLRAGDVLVIAARGRVDAGVLGSILATRAQLRGAAGIVTDGAFRDAAGVAALTMPTFAGGSNPNLSSVRHYPVDLNVDVDCGGVLVRPGDVIVGDDDGVVVVPEQLADEVLRDAVEQERLERYLVGRIRAGEPITDVYPPSEAVLAEYRAVRSEDETA
jgi:regulator of RNase E activity RraA